jgi:pimeloyl-ACP methyl ester carboxylesterase
MLVSRAATVRRAVVATTAIAVVAGLTMVGGATARASRALDAARPATMSTTTVSALRHEVQAPIPKLHWKKCSSFSGRMQCAHAKVPRDYDHPYGAKTTLTLSRVRATDPSKRIGTLFVNPGGPGAPASEFPGLFAQVLGRHVAQRFDLVGIDPRGVGGSAPLICRDPPPNSAHPKRTIAFPYTSREIREWLRFDAYTSQLCATHSRPILDHMSTADTARDMDLIRQALGESKLSYYGISYGTYLGATYAALFPDRIRSMVLDGVLDPVAWATGRDGQGRKVPFSNRLHSGIGSWQALTSAFAECDRVGRSRCPLAGHAAFSWHQVIHRLRKGPVTFPHRFVLHYSDIVGLAAGALYSRSSYRPLMRLIADVHAQLFAPRGARPLADAASAYQRLKAKIRRADVTSPYGFGPHRFDMSFSGIACADSINPSDPRVWIRAARQADQRSPWFGAYWTWVSSTCATWPGSSADAFRGSFRTRTSEPVLIVGNTYDPATPISGARRLNTLFAGSRLLTLVGWGHGAIGESRCVTKRTQGYLVRGILPLSGKSCKEDKQLFPRRPAG